MRFIIKGAKNIEEFKGVKEKLESIPQDREHGFPEVARWEYGTMTIQYADGYEESSGSSVLVKDFMENNENVMIEISATPSFEDIGICNPTIYVGNLADVPEEYQKLHVVEEGWLIGAQRNQLIVPEQEVKDIIRKDIMCSGFKPDVYLIDDIEKLMDIKKSPVTLREIRSMAEEREKLSRTEKWLVDKIAEECKAQEQQRIISSQIIK